MISVSHCGMLSSLSGVFFCYYVIFSDATLMDMCKKLPTTIEEFLGVSGVGKVKLELYGEVFLQVLKLYSRSRTDDLID